MTSRVNSITEKIRSAYACEQKRALREILVVYTRPFVLSSIFLHTFLSSLQRIALFKEHYPHKFVPYVHLMDLPVDSDAHASGNDIWHKGLNPIDLNIKNFYGFPLYTARKKQEKVFNSIKMLKGSHPFRCEIFKSISSTFPTTALS